jgi:hypothetical protein
MKILCVISTASHEPFNEIFFQGTLPHWAQEATQVQVCILQCSQNSRLIRTMDNLREQIRSKKNWAARIGQIIDLSLTPLSWYIPYTKISSFNQKIVNLDVLMPEILSLYRWKYLAAMKYFLEKTDMDYLYTVNSSCFVRENELIEFVSANQSIKYAGTLIRDAKTGNYFPSGANRLISREMARTILKNRHRWPLHLTEDISLGRMMERMRFQPTPLPTLNLDSVDQIKMLDMNEHRGQFHFRLKSSFQGKRTDVTLFKELAKRLIS